MENGEWRIYCLGGVIQNVTDWELFVRLGTLPQTKESDHNPQYTGSYLDIVCSISATLSMHRIVKFLDRMYPLHCWHYTGTTLHCGPKRGVM